MAPKIPDPRGLLPLHHYLRALYHHSTCKRLVLGLVGLCRVSVVKLELQGVSISEDRVNVIGFRMGRGPVGSGLHFLAARTAYLAWFVIGPCNLPAKKVIPFHTFYRIVWTGTVVRPLASLLRLPLGSD